MVLVRADMHPVLQQALSYGYGETFGEDRVKSAFQTYLDVLDINPPHLKATNEVVGRFLDFLANERQPTDDENSGSEAEHDVVEVLGSSEEDADSMEQSITDKDSESADEIECSSDEDDMSPSFAGKAATSIPARRARRSATLVMCLFQPLLNFKMRSQDS